MTTDYEALADEMNEQTSTHEARKQFYAAGSDGVQRAKQAITELDALRRRFEKHVHA